MDNLTHSFVGLVAAKAGLEKLSPGATLLCLIAANGPDSDIAVLPFGDRWTYLQHHRGITHSIVGVACLALLIPLLFYFFDLLWSRLRNSERRVKLKGLIITSLIVSATHPLLDWTNNYGIRPFLPWSQEWFYGDLVFIVDPYMWLILGGAAFLLSAKTISGKVIWGLVAAVPTLLIIVSSRSGSLPSPRFFALFWIAAIIVLIILFMKGAGDRWGRQIAFTSLVLVLCYWSLLAVAHSTAVTRASQEAQHIARSNGESIARLAAMPRLANPFRWDCVFETDRAAYRFDVGLINAAQSRDTVRYVKPTGELKESVEAVSQQRPAQVFLGFARFPVSKLADPECASRTLVQFADLRYTEPGQSRGTFTLELPVDCPDPQQEHERD
jgi:inner membrane protein